mgnify:CR=1 FL=1
MASPSSVVRTSGGLVSTNAQIKVACGFKPAFVHVVNQTTNTAIVWNAGMPQDSGLRQSGSALGSQFVTTSGIKTYEDSGGEGFTIEPGGPVNPAGSNNLYWSAFRGDGSPGN